MTFDVITIFPGFFGSILEHGLLKRALAAGQVSIRIHDLRGFTDDRHHVVDDRPFGGGPGMVLKPEPLFRAVEALQAASDSEVVLLSPQGRLFSQRVAEELADKRQVILICGRYEGVDERVAAELATDEISIGDYVLAGGELPAAVVMEAVTRLVPGVVGNEESTRQDSFSLAEEAAKGLAGQDGQGARGLLDCPHYTRPVEFRGLRVPEVLLSGDHEEIRRWRRRESIARTWRRRPDLLKYAALEKEDLKALEDMKREAKVAANES
ncbi:MAG TPA: tRNA (guanosine(37)-N1)-methyltransferase TrmD [Terriglobia bacterium]|nr:tRNA (guanosine(37)-N1)-methyltransferase TrmD [Terriglobia bacterium]